MANNRNMKDGDLNAALNVTGSCTLCGQKADCKCDRCGDYYCSDVCQRKDWASHRYICLPMPKLVKASPCSSQTGFPITDSQNQVIAEKAKSSKAINPLPNGSCVCITGFKSSNVCYVRSTNPSTLSDYIKILNEIDKFGSKSSGLNQQPKMNSYALALRGGKWCRVKVVVNKKNACNVIFLDIGYMTSIPFQKLRTISESIINLPCLVQNVQLKGISFCVSSRFLDSLTKYTNKEYKIVYANPEKCSGEVELFQWGTEILLNSLIIKALPTKNTANEIDDAASACTKLSTTPLQNNGKFNNKDSAERTCNGSSDKKFDEETKMSKEATKSDGSEVASSHSLSSKKSISAVPRQIQKPCLMPPFDNIPINEQDGNCKILVMDNSYIASGYIGCLLEKHYENLKSVLQFLKEYNVGDQSYKPKIHEYCLANYEGEWYRAKVMEIISEDKFLVVYIDFTNEMEVNSKSIRRYPVSLNLHCYTTLCAIDGLTEVLTDKMKSFLESNCVPFQHLYLDSVQIKDGTPHVKCNELISKMRDSNIL